MNRKDTLENINLISGTDATAASRSAIGRISFGPREQLMPIALTPSPWSVSAAASGGTPRKVRPEASNVIVVNTGRSQISRAASTAAFVSSRSVMVSI